VTTPSVAPEMGPQARHREQRGWYFYDWANSAFSTTVATVFLAPYLDALAEQAAGADGFVHPLGILIRADSFHSYPPGTASCRPGWHRRWHQGY
jgi:UMF1 family MFS transporter